MKCLLKTVRCFRYLRQAENVLTIYDQQSWSYYCLYERITSLSSDFSTAKSEAGLLYSLLPLPEAKLCGGGNGDWQAKCRGIPQRKQTGILVMPAMMRFLTRYISRGRALVHDSVILLSTLLWLPCDWIRRNFLGKFLLGIMPRPEPRNLTPPLDPTSASQKCCFVGSKGILSLLTMTIDWKVLFAITFNS